METPSQPAAAEFYFTPATRRLGREIPGGFQGLTIHDRQEPGTPGEPPPGLVLGATVAARQDPWAIMPSVEVELDVLVRVVGGIPDQAMRAAYLRHTLLSKQPDEVADLFTVAMIAAEGRQPGHAELLQAMSLALEDEACQGLRDAARAVLEGRNLPGLAHALRRDAVTEAAETQRIPDFGRGRTLSLGERKSIARSSDRNLIARVLRDPHPDVIRIVLGNPTLTETDVVRLCARRPASTEVLREVFRSARWIVRYPVKVAIVLNPYTPLDIALQLAPHLTTPDVKRVLAAEDLNDELREACRRAHGRTETTTIH